jgi:hypothetical protein
VSKHMDRRIGAEKGANAAEDKKRPEFITDEHLIFLDELRESGETNMFGARPYVMEEFEDLTEEQASAIVLYWMKTFGKPNR